MRQWSLPAASLLIATTLVSACTAAKAPTGNGPVPTQSAQAPTANRDIAGKLFARNNKATPKGDIKVATLLKDDKLGIAVTGFQLRVQPAKTMSTKSEPETSDDHVDEVPTGTDVEATATPTPSPDDHDDDTPTAPGSDQVAHGDAPAGDDEWDDHEWETNSDTSDDDWLEPETKDDPDDIDAFGETDASFRGGKPHHLVFHESDYPVMDDELDSLVIEDKTTGKKAILKADQEFVNFTFTGASGKTVKIGVNPDGSFTVDGKTVPSAVEAAALINAVLNKDEVTSETLALMYASLKQRDRTIATLGAVSTQGGPNSGESTYEKEDREAKERESAQAQITAAMLAARND